MHLIELLLPPIAAASRRLWQQERLRLLDRPRIEIRRHPSESLPSSSCARLALRNSMAANDEQAIMFKERSLFAKPSLGKILSSCPMDAIRTRCSLESWKVLRHVLHDHLVASRRVLVLLILQQSHSRGVGVGYRNSVVMHGAID